MASDMQDGSDAFDQVDWRQVLSSLRSELISKGISDKFIDKIRAILEQFEHKRDQLSATHFETVKSLQDLEEKMKLLKEVTMANLKAKDEHEKELLAKVYEQDSVIHEACEMLQKLCDQTIAKNAELAAYRRIFGHW
jgi:hypothetical protein